MSYKCRAIHVVIGTCGQLADAAIWHVKAFHRAAHARRLCKRLNKWCADNRVDPAHAPVDVAAVRALSCPDDPEFDTDTNGTLYEVVEVPHG